MKRRPFGAVFQSGLTVSALALAATFALAALGGCRGKEEKPPAGYYEGPMKPKGSTGGTGQPAAPGSPTGQGVPGASSGGVE